MSTVQAEYHTSTFPQCTRRVSYTVAVSVHKHTNITHFALRTLAHAPITHTQKAVSKLTLASLSLSLTKSQCRKEGEEEKNEWERGKQNGREGKWGCHQKTKNKKEKNEAGRTVISKSTCEREPERSDVPERKTERRNRREQDCALRDLLREKWRPTLSSDCGSSMTEETDEWENNREMDWKKWVRVTQQLQRELKEWRVCYAWM